MQEAAILTVFPILVAFAGCSDLFTMTIPNRVSIILIAAFLVAAPLVGMGAIDIAWHLGAGGIVFAFGFFFFAMGWMGGGDVKVATAIAIWFGFSGALVDFVVFSALYGSLLTLGLLSFRSNFPVLPGIARSQGWLLRLHEKSSGIPYGIALTAAALQVYPHSMWFASLMPAG